MKKNKKAKIFHGLVNYGTQSGLFARELRRNGFNAISVTHFDSYKRLTDVELSSEGSFWFKLVNSISNHFFLLKCFFKYDIFHFYFGSTLFPFQIDLYFYKLFGKKVVMEYLGNDVRPYEKLIEKFNLGIDHPFFINQIPHDNKVRKRLLFENKFIDYKLVCSPIYKSHANFFGIEIQSVLNLAIEMPEKIDYPAIVNNKLIIMHAPTCRKFKGTYIFEAAINKLKHQGYLIEFIILENLDHSDLINEIKKCHIFLDQISEGWYGTVAIEAMALSKPTCAFLDSEYLEECEFKDEIPLFNTSKDNVYYVIKNLLDSQNKLPFFGLKSREFVAKHHDIQSVVKFLSKIYLELSFYNK